MDSFGSFEDHGGINPQELDLLGVSIKNLIDFSVNSNPFGLSPRVLEAIHSVDVSVYPDRECMNLKELLAKANAVSQRQVLLGNGTADLIWLITRVLLNPGDKVIVVGPTFGEYRRASEMAGAQVTEIRSTPPLFHQPIKQMIDLVVREKPRLVFLCNPNNPTGHYLAPQEVEGLITACGNHTILVLDEAYKAFINGQFFGGLPADNCMILRSMTKDFCLAGLRLGYVLADQKIIDRLKHYQPPWSVNALAQAAGVAAFSDLKYYEQTLFDLRVLSRKLFMDMIERGLDLVPSNVHFFLIRLNRPANVVRNRLMRESVQVRDCASFGLLDYIRIGARLDVDNRKLLDLIHIFS